MLLLEPISVIPNYFMDHYSHAKAAIEAVGSPCLKYQCVRLEYASFAKVCCSCKEIQSSIEEEHDRHVTALATNKNYPPPAHDSLFTT